MGNAQEGTRALVEWRKDESESGLKAVAVRDLQTSETDSTPSTTRETELFELRQLEAELKTIIDDNETRRATLAQRIRDEPLAQEIQRDELWAEKIRYAAVHAGAWNYIRENLIIGWQDPPLPEGWHPAAATSAAGSSSVSNVKTEPVDDSMDVEDRKIEPKRKKRLKTAKKRLETVKKRLLRLRKRKNRRLGINLDFRCLRIVKRACWKLGMRI
eukprot:GABV01000888.1.p1 GENE.GABV01000888.1~~GABV01000888.1.p1  ORF type:complete len:215 (-),score=68.82 GABV01000888.1:278-922(-)